MADFSTLNFFRKEAQNVNLGVNLPINVICLKAMSLVTLNVPGECPLLVHARNARNLLNLIVFQYHFYFSSKYVI